jgi:RimJ/RimL family protein N-acetyltransferase
LKTDPEVFGAMLNGVRSPACVREELEDDIDYWRAREHGTWAVERPGDGVFLGIVGLADRPDGRGVALRFALGPTAQGCGYAREAARAALGFGHGPAGLPRIIAVAHEANLASRAVLAGIGMRECGHFLRCGRRKLVFESWRDAYDARCSPMV